MSEQEKDVVRLDEVTLPYRSGEFQEVADRLGKVAESLGRYPALGFVTHELQFAAAALHRAEGLLASGGGAMPAMANQVEASAASTPPAATGVALGAAGRPEVGARGEWTGYVGRQPTFDRLKDGRIRGVFFLAQHPDPNDRDKTDWLRCYSLGRHA